MLLKPWDEQNQDERAATLKRARRKRPAHPAWKSLREIAISTIRAFESDFWIHDMAALAGQPASRTFLWACGESGTHLTWCDDYFAEAVRRGHAESRTSEWIDTLREMRPSMHFWDGTTLHEVEYLQAINVLMCRHMNDFEED